MWAQAPITMSILLVTVGAYLVQSQLGLAPRLAQDNFLVGQGQWWRMLTVVLVHASITHLLFNMWALYNLGPSVETAVGRLAFLGLYLGAAAVGGLFAFQFGGAADRLVGASGAIFGLFGFWLHSAFRSRTTMFGRAILSQLGFLLLINAALPLLIPSISWQGHLGGLVAGLLIAEIWSRVPKSESARILSALAVLLLAIAATSL
jgi:rhomboid protease GluP